MTKLTKRAERAETPRGEEERPVCQRIPPGVLCVFPSSGACLSCRNGPPGALNLTSTKTSRNTLKRAFHVRIGKQASGRPTHGRREQAPSSITGGGSGPVLHHGRRSGPVLHTIWTPRRDATPPCFLLPDPPVGGPGPGPRCSFWTSADYCSYRKVECAVLTPTP